MTNINPRWDRWIYASVAKHVQTSIAAHDPNLLLHVEGQGRDTDDVGEWLEFRMDGPWYMKKSRNDYRAYVELNILCTTLKGTDGYRIHELTGFALETFQHTIGIYKYGDAGDDPENDGSLLGWIHHNLGRREWIKKSFFGNIRPDTALIQASVEAHYRMFIDI